MHSLDPPNPRNLYYEKAILEKTSPTSSIDPDQMLQLIAVGLVAGFTKMADLQIHMRSRKILVSVFFTILGNTDVTTGGTKKYQKRKKKEKNLQSFLVLS